MATGTGKTWTAIFLQKLLEQHPAMVVICAPYKHLVRQWADDVIKAFPDAKIVMVSSENAKWESQLSDLIIRKKYQKDLQIIVISTIASFKMQRFNKGSWIFKRAEVADCRRSTSFYRATGCIA